MGGKGSMKAVVHALRACPSSGSYLEPLVASSQAYAHSCSLAYASPPPPPGPGAHHQSIRVLPSLTPSSRPRTCSWVCGGKCSWQLAVVPGPTPAYGAPWTGLPCCRAGGEAFEVGSSSRGGRGQAEGKRGPQPACPSLSQPPSRCFSQSGPGAHHGLSCRPGILWG